LTKTGYQQIGIMNSTYLYEKINDYKNSSSNPNRGKPHPLADRSLALIWIRVRDKTTFEKVADLIENGVPSSGVSGGEGGKAGPRRKVIVDPEAKCETASSGVASFFDAYRDLIWAVKFLLVPAILITMTLVIANAISISVRERRTEMAVLKVLGFRPWHVLVLVLGEALVVGVLSGFLGGLLVYGGFNWTMGGIPFPVVWIGVFPIPGHALWWGPAVGLLTASFGSIIPAWSARTVKVSDVFAKVT
jgi:putative ABC transport system permease protein